VLADDAFVPVHFISDSVLWRISFQRTQQHDSILTLRSVVDAATRKEFHRLPDAEFVTHRPNTAV